MTTNKSRLTFAIVLILSTTLLSACGGKKSRAEKAAQKQASPTQDITYPPTIISPDEETPEA